MRCAHRLQGRGGEGRGAQLPVEGLLLQHYMQVLLGVPICQVVLHYNSPQTVVDINIQM